MWRQADFFSKSVKHNSYKLKMALEKEETQMLKASAPSYTAQALYPLLENKNNATLRSSEHTTDLDLVYRLNRINDILNELKQEKKHYETVYKKYKILHKTLYTTQLAANSSSVISATCTAGSLVSGVGAVTTVPLGFISVASGCMGILLGIFDQKTLKKMKKHSKLVQLAATMNSEIIQKYLNHQHITKEEFSEVLKLLEKYYSLKEELRSKSQLVGNLDTLKAEFIEQGKKLAFLEAMQREAQPSMHHSKVI